MTTLPETLAPGTRLIHLGPQKTGSTSIQVALFGVRDEAQAHGTYIPGRRPRRRKAAYALGLPDGRQGWPIAPWNNLVAEVEAAGDARVVISNEDFARTDDPAIIGRIVRELGGSHPVHVVLVARRMDRFLPSQWQQRVKYRVLQPWEEWLEVVLGDDSTHREHRNVWLGHDVAALAARWLEHVDPGAVSVIVSDEDDRTQQARVFARLLGLPDGMVRADPERGNRSLTLAEVELVRSIAGLWAREGWSHDDYRALVIRGVVKELGSSPPTDSGPRSATLPDWAHARVQELSERRIEDLSALPVNVVGDVQHLRVPGRESSGTAAGPQEPTLPVDRVLTAMQSTIAAAVRARAV